MRVATEDLQSHWATLGPMQVIRSEDDYERAVEHLNQLLDYVGVNEQHPLYTLLDTLGTLIHAYEEQHHPMPECSGVDVLRFLMDEHGLTQSDLPETGHRGWSRTFSGGSVSLISGRFVHWRSGSRCRQRCLSRAVSVRAWHPRRAAVASASRRGSGPALLRQAKLSVSCRVKGPVGSGRATHL